MVARISPALLASASRTDTIDAAYFVIRALRNTLRGYQSAAVSTEPSPEAHRLAERALSEIEEQEGASIADLDARTVEQYIALLEGFQRDTYVASVGRDEPHAESVLDEMRSSSL